MTTLSLNEDRPVLYVNVVIEDASEAIRAGVSQKIEDSSLPPKIKTRLAKHVGQFAADYVKAAKVVSRMAPKMVEEMPIKMKKKGLTVHAKEVFRHGPFFVIQIQVQHVNAAVMMEAKKMAGKNGFGGNDTIALRVIKWMLSCTGVTLADTVQTDYLPDLIQKKIHPSMGMIMVEELAEKKMKAAVQVLPEQKQSRFFYALLQQVREGEAAKKGAKRLNQPPKLFAHLKAKKWSVSSLSSR